MAAPQAWCSSESVRLCRSKAIASSVRPRLPRIRDFVFSAWDSTSGSPSRSAVASATSTNSAAISGSPRKNRSLAIWCASEARSSSGSSAASSSYARSIRSRASSIRPVFHSTSVIRAETRAASWVAPIPWNSDSARSIRPARSTREATVRSSSASSEARSKYRRA